MQRTPRFLGILSAAVLVGGAVIAACSGRTVDTEVDYTQEVEQICEDFCTINLACHEPPVFESQVQCRDTCTELAYIKNDTACGEAHREFMACVAATTTCAEYNDTNNVDADNYTCKAEKTAFIELNCPQSSEEP